MTREEFDAIVTETLDSMRIDESMKDENAPDTWGLEWDICKDIEPEEFKVICVIAVRGYLSQKLADKAQFN